MPQNRAAAAAEPQGRSENNPDRTTNAVPFPDQPDLPPPEAGPSPGSMSSFSSLLLWILGGSSEGLNSFFSMFRDVREQGQVFVEPAHENQ